MSDPLVRHDLVQVRPFAHEMLGGKVLEVMTADDDAVRCIVGWQVVTLPRDVVVLVGRMRWCEGGHEVAQ